MNQPPESICILRLSAIGDVCHTVPVVQTLKACLPDARITWIVGKVEAGLVAGIPGVEFLVLDKAAGWSGLRALRAQLAGRRFDVLLHMQAALRASIASLAVEAPRRIGFDRARARDLQWLFTNERIAAREREHVMDGLFGFAGALGITERDLLWDVPVPDAARAFAAQHVPRAGGALVISPCASRTERNWRPERYAAVADYARERFGLEVVLTGGPSSAERGMGEAILKHMNARPVNLIGRTSLKELLAVFERCAALIAPDSGPAHVGTMAGIPVIGLYAVSNPDRTGPYLSRHLLVNRYPENAKRYFGKSVEELRWGARVWLEDGMDAITVVDVKDRLDAVMASSSIAADPDVQSPPFR